MIMPKDSFYAQFPKFRISKTKDGHISCHKDSLPTPTSTPTLIKIQGKGERWTQQWCWKINRSKVTNCQIIFLHPRSNLYPESAPRSGHFMSTKVSLGIKYMYQTPFPLIYKESILLTKTKGISASGSVVH